MGEETKIEWTDHSWSPWRGCTKVSPGCANCYAETLSKRNPAVLGQWGKGKPRVMAKNWGDPVRWNKAGHVCGECGKTTHGGTCFHGQCKGTTHRPTIFPSLCDWLDDDVPVEWLARFLNLIHDTPNLTWLLLTKRPENWEKRLRDVCVYFQGLPGDWTQAPAWQFANRWCPHNGVHRFAPPLNVWVGTSVEDQTRADERIPALLSIPAAGRFLSVEPLLGPVDLAYQGGSMLHGVCTMCVPFNCELHGSGELLRNAPCNQKIHWVIIGGESGPGARPCNVEWIRSLVRQCKDASVPCFVKQLGGMSVMPSNVEGISGPVPLFVKHRKGGDPTEWPEDLQWREFPEGLR